jgi:diguanylate cyclase
MEPLDLLPPVPAPPGAPLPLARTLEQAGTDTARAAAYLALARHYRDHSLALALPLAQAALTSALAAGIPDTTVDVLAVLAALEVGQGRHERAFEHLALALDLARQHGLRALEAQVRNSRAIARLSTGDLVGARRDLLDARALAQEAGDRVDVAHTYVNLAYLENLAGHGAESLHQLNLLEEALPALPEAEGTALRLYLFENRAHTYLNLARRASERGRPDAEAEARARAHAALRATRRALAAHPSRILALSTEAHAARLALLEGRLERAQAHAEAALDHHREVDEQAYLDAHLAMAEVSAARGQARQAHASYAAALDAARAQRRHRETGDILRAVARLHEAEGNLPAALAASREALDSAQVALDRLAHIEQRHDDLSSELRQARAEASSWQDSVRRAEAQARLDPLTGLLNRRGLGDALSGLADGAGPLLVALFDIDDFKNVNDQHSHVVGDAALRTVAERLGTQVPAGSLLARYGGEEFLLVVPQVTPAQAPALVEGLRRAIEAHDWAALPGDLTLTVSAGYALADSPQENAFWAAFEQADDHLYQAKRAGRNRVSPPVLVSG